MTEYMSSKEAAKRWGVTQTTVAKWCREGLLKNGTVPFGTFMEMDSCTISTENC